MTLTVSQIGSQTLYVVFTAGGQRYAVVNGAVREMVQPPPVVPIPGAGPEVRGLINLRGSVMRLMDFRTALGQPSAEQEANALLAELDTYEGHHRSWVDELEASVTERRPFTLTTDPTACAFGRWYATFETDNVMLAQQLASFDEPHRRVHALADEVGQLVAAGRHDEARTLVTSARSGVLSMMILLFQRTRDVVRQARRDIAMVMRDEGSNRAFAVLVDSVESIEALQPHDEDLEGAASHPLLNGVAIDGEDRLVLLMDPAGVVSWLDRVSPGGKAHGA